MSQGPCSLEARLPSLYQVLCLTVFQGSLAHLHLVVLRPCNLKTTPKCMQANVPPSAVLSRRKTLSNHRHHRAHSRRNSVASRMVLSHHPLWHIHRKILLACSPNSIHSNRLQWDSSLVLHRIYSTCLAGACTRRKA